MHGEGRHDTQHNGICHYETQHKDTTLSKMALSLMLNAAYKPFMLSVGVLNGVRLSVVMLSVLASVEV